jgi:protein SCO1/2
MKNKLNRSLVIALLCGYCSLLLAQEEVNHMSHSSPQGINTEGSDKFINPTEGINIDFVLMDSSGTLVTEEQFRGKYVLMTFGFTQCPHICPMIASNMARVLKSSTNANLTGIFVSVDTERDTPQITNDYASGFHKDMIGLAGTYEQISNASNNFKVSYSVTKTQKHYTVQHTTNIYLIGPDGELVDVFAMNASPDTISAKIN